MKEMAVLFLLGAALAAAPPSSGRQNLPRPMARGAVPGSGLFRDPRFASRLLQIRVNRIQQVVGLPEDRARMVADRWARWDREHMERGEQASNLRHQFNQILLGPEREEDKSARLKPLLDQFMVLRAQQESARRQFEEDIRAGLTPAQQARLILVMDEIQQRLRESLQDLRHR